MKIDKRVFIPSLLFVLVFSYASWTIVAQKEKAQAVKLDVVRTDTPIVFYFGETCPHCKLVEEFIEKNDVKSKVKFSEKEVYHNKDNANEAVAKAALCGIDKKDLGVPFLWDGEKCYIGDEKIINFFKEKINE